MSSFVKNNYFGKVKRIHTKRIALSCKKKNNKAIKMITSLIRVQLHLQVKWMRVKHNMNWNHMQLLIFEHHLKVKLILESLCAHLIQFLVSFVELHKWIYNHWFIITFLVFARKIMINRKILRGFNFNFWHRKSNILAHQSSQIWKDHSQQWLLNLWNLKMINLQLSTRSLSFIVREQLKKHI